MIVVCASESLQRLDAAAHEGTPPQPNRVFAHAERLGDPRAGPASQRQQHGTRAVRLAAIARAGQNHQRCSLRLARRERRFSRHVLHLRIGADRESTLQALVNHAESA
jgi:hypothetical protein